MDGGAGGAAALTGGDCPYPSGEGVASPTGRQSLVDCTRPQGDSPHSGTVPPRAHIGRGTIGAQRFQALLGRPSLTDTPAVIETPKEADADVRNLRLLRRLRAEAARPRTGQQRG